MSANYCSDCGTEIESGTSFCPECGQQIGGGETEKQETQTSTESTVNEEEGINWGKAGKAAGIGFLPAFGAYMLISVASYGAIVAVLPIGIAVFGYLLYDRPTTKAMFGGAFFWLAVEALLSPVFMIFYTVAFASEETTTAAGEAGAAIGGGILVIMAFVVGLPVGIVFYLISRKLDV